MMIDKMEDRVKNEYRRRDMPKQTKIPDSKTGSGSSQKTLSFVQGLSSREVRGLRTSDKLHLLLLSIMPRLPSDFAPYGQRSRLNDAGVIESDCSGDCKHFEVLQSMPEDWGVCTNPKSPRCGLLTFEHQGCPEYEQINYPEEAG